MPRSVGRGLQAAAAALQPLLQLALQDRFISGRQRELREFIGEQQAGEQAAQFTQAQLDKILERARGGEDIDALEDQAAALGRPVELDAFAPTLTQTIQQTLKPFEDETDPQRLAGGGEVVRRRLGISGQAPFRPEVDEAISFPERRRQALIEAEPPEFIEGLTDGRSGRIPISPSTGQPREDVPIVPTERSVSEELARTLGTDLSPEAIGRRVDESAQTAEAGERARQTPDLVAGRVAEAGATSRAQASGRLSAEFDPDVQRARIAESLEIEFGKIGAALEQEQREAALAAGNASAAFAPTFQSLVELTDRINTAEEGGVAQRASGLIREGAARIGLDPDVRQLGQLVSASVRPIAMAMGMREANISESEQARAEEVLGVSALSTREERNNALRNVRDLINLGPIIAGRLPSTATFGDRLALALELQGQTQAAERRAIQAAIALEAQGAIFQGALTFVDPVTETRIPVIR